MSVPQYPLSAGHYLYFTLINKWYNSDFLFPIFISVLKIGPLFMPLKCFHIIEVRLGARYSWSLCFTYSVQKLVSCIMQE